VAPRRGARKPETPEWTARSARVPRRLAADDSRAGDFDS